MSSGFINKFYNNICLTSSFFSKKFLIPNIPQLTQKVIGGIRRIILIYIKIWRQNRKNVISPDDKNLYLLYYKYGEYAR
jgi:hypothetical protein